MNANEVPAWATAPDDEVARLRVPPHSVAAEQGVLGGLLLDCQAYDLVADLLTESSFYRREHQVVFAAISELVAASKPADVVTVFVQLQAKRQDEEAGGLQYLNDLAQSVPSAANIRRYAEIVANQALLRGVIAASDEVATAAFQATDAVATLDAAQARFNDLAKTRKTREPVPVGAMLASRVDRINDLAAGNVAPGISTGKPALDDKLGGGLRAGLVVVAARPSVGKSSFTADIGMYVAETAGPVLFVSQEMSVARVTDRCLSNVAGVRLRSILTGKLTDEDWGRMSAAVDRLRTMPFLIDDEPAQTLAKLRRKARAVKGLRLLIVDYLQLCGSDLKTDSRNAQIEELTRGLKALSTELDIPILALSQLNRAVEGRQVKRPNLGDLRDSGAIEQDADVVMFLWNARENADDKAAGVRIVGCGIDKNRDGPLAEMAFAFRGSVQQWEESDVDVRPPAQPINRGGYE